VISVSALVSGEQLGGLLAEDDEEAAMALLTLAAKCDVEELTDRLEDALMGEDKSTLDKMAALANLIGDAIERVQR